METPRDSGGVLVLGATGGIGRALARRLHRDGVPVLLAGRDEERLRSLGEELASPHRVLDARDFGDVREALVATREATGGLAGAAHCIGSVLLKPAHLTTAAEFREVFEVHLLTAFALVAAAGREMRHGGSVVLVGAAAARGGIANHEAIGAVKGGIEGLVRSAAATYAPRNLRFNAVAPGLVRTPMTERIFASEGARKASAALHALPRLGEPEDVAAAMAFLLGPDASWITGELLGVDGGLSFLKSPA